MNKHTGTTPGYIMDIGIARERIASSAPVRGRHGVAHGTPGSEGRVMARFNRVLRRIVMRPALGLHGVAYSRG